ncbi:ATP-dependent helicase [Roseobacter denitrificans]|uniref:Putative ATP-dependent RNA helicase, putative n=1 Tax=Roseobacter denitrificans (strain ATCC 33942 / OCh 114) TaxID=375451 RepID=Q164E7_ROSDO|nr:DEAD/DEAH box helicase [Roseobacter denitrificans]ABG32646.1 putative ATP-dependent RNA helicase, putative [Roseobacter denitrificans OCh 114]AVL52082.1 ATP-dependent helicase [Roseobacter denitrificans]SFF93212.1 ATP-dependent RNA helicase RhlE [Roseobacter denitrificans OCh 114]
MSDFEMMNLPPELVARLGRMGLKDPTPIQKQAIPHAMNGRDVMGLAQTGTGKTAAFGVPLVAQMLELDGRPAPKSVRGLVLAPTRELATQISVNLRSFAENTKVKVAMVVGGQSINNQIKRLERGVDLLVATPGRLLDLMDRRAVRLDEAVFLVLDEADQMLDMGFIHDLRKIASVIPKERQTMLFSATMPKQMNELANSYLRSPIRVEVSPPGKAADKVTQEVHFIAKSEKPGLLIEMLDKHRDERALVFGRTKHGSEKLMKSLVKAGYAAGSIHGNKSQGQRDRAIAAFKSGEIKVLVATDVAARGLDIPDVKHVYNYDLPNVPDNYVHRIGRTARAGKDGAAIAFCAPDEMGELKAIQKTMGISIPVGSGRPWEAADIPPGDKTKGRGRGRGGRPPQAGKPAGGRPGGPRKRAGARNRRGKPAASGGANR